MKTEPKNTPFRSVADLVAPMSFLDFHKMYWGKGFHYFPATDERAPCPSQRALYLDEFP